MSWWAQWLSPRGHWGAGDLPHKGDGWAWGVLGSLVLGPPHATVPIWDGHTCTPGAAGKNSSRTAAGRRATRVRPRSLRPLFSCFTWTPLHGGKDGAQGEIDALGHAHVPRRRGQCIRWWRPLLGLGQPAVRGSVPKGALVPGRHRAGAVPRTPGGGCLQLSPFVWIPHTRRALDKTNFSSPFPPGALGTGLSVPCPPRGH